MSVVRDRQIGELEMSATADIQLAASLLTDLERADQHRRDANIADTRRRLARLLHVSPRTLEKIRAAQLKSIPYWLMARLRAELITILQAEIRRLAHEIHIHQQAGVDDRDVDFAKAKAALAEAQKVLKGERS